MIRIACGGLLLAIGCLFLLAAIGLFVDPAIGPSESAPWVVIMIAFTVFVLPGLLLCFWGWRARKVRRELEAERSAAAIGRMLSRMSAADAQQLSERLASIAPEQGAAYATACAKLTSPLEPKLGLENTFTFVNGLTDASLTFSRGL